MCDHKKSSFHFSLPNRASGGQEVISDCLSESRELIASQDSDLNLVTETLGQVCWELLGKGPFSKTWAGGGETLEGWSWYDLKLQQMSCYSPRKQLVGGGQLHDEEQAEPQHLVQLRAPFHET